jgi:hypothetical protein
MVIPVFGNNDYKIHYQSPEEDQKKSFYSKLMKNWFYEHPYNSKIMNTELIESTFLEGGYYRVNIPGGNISVLAMNSITFSPKNN